MKRSRILLTTFAALLVMGCSEYDDSALWKKVDETQKQLAELSASLTQLEGQIGLLTAAKTGGVITGITENPDGGFTITYTTVDGKSATASVASKEDLTDADIIGTKEENGILYWTITAGGKTTILTDKDGAKIPVAGREPSFTTDKEGYWMVNGSYILDSNGEKMKSEGKKASLLTGVAKNDDGTVTLTLADGSTVTVETTESFSFVVYYGDAPVSGEIKVPDGVGSLELTYKLAGKAAEKASVRITRAEGVEAGIDQNARRVNVTVPDGLRKARITLIAAGEDGRMAARTIYLRGTFSVETENDLWRTVEEKLLAPGCNYYSMEFKKIARKMHVLEIDLTNPAIEVTTAYADDIVPNPNGNKNGNNGFNLRETLSQLCVRKTAEGEDVIAGINTGFFDSNDGFTRGAHIEDGELVYMNNPAVVANLGNHAWAFTIFKDNTASCGKKVFSGKVKIADKEYKFYSVNDTLVRGNNASQLASYPINLYTSRYVKIPHKERQDIVNKLSTRALYVTAKYSADNMTVNDGWFAATVTAIADGRATALEEAPYLTDKKEVGIQITGTTAEEISKALKVGDEIQLSAEMAVDGEVKPIFTQNSTMWQFVTDGQNTLNTVPANHTFRALSDPMTFACIDRSGSRIMLVEIDGRQEGFSIGVNAEEVTDISLRLGAWNATRFDGGGSSAMWAKKDGVSGLVSRPSDKKGERSCMNYMYVRIKK